MARFSAQQYVQESAEREQEAARQNLARAMANMTDDCGRAKDVLEGEEVQYDMSKQRRLVSVSDDLRNRARHLSEALDALALADAKLDLLRMMKDAREHDES